MRIVLMIFLLVGMTIPPALSQPIALVIGNSDYENAAPVASAANDARSIAAALRQTGFEVKLTINGGVNALRAALADFAAAAAGTDTALIFYTGHGFALAGKSYIVPSDAKLENASAPWFELISLDAILSSLQGASGLKLALIDAGTSHRFTQALRKDEKSVPPVPGLAPIDPPTGTGVVYSAKIGTSALMGAGGKNSPFAAAVLEHIADPGQDVGSLVESLKRDVARLTNQAQSPQLFGSGNAGLWTEETKAPVTAQASPQAPSADEAAQAWRLIKDTTDPSDIEAYLEVYGASNKLYARLAQKRLAALTASPAPSTGASAPAGGVAPAAPSAVAQPEIDPGLQGKQLALMVQVELNRLGCSAGNPDGVWGRNSRKALRLFASHSGAALAATEPSITLLRAMRATTGRICPVSCRVTENLVNGQCIAKTCPAGERLSSKGVCYTVKAKRRAAKCPRGQRLNSRGRCYTPRANRNVNRRASGGTVYRAPRRTRSKDPNVGLTPPAGSCILNPPCRRDE